MKRITYLTLIALIVAMLLPTDLYGARRRRKRKSVKASPVISYIHMYGGVGYSNFMQSYDNLLIAPDSPLNPVFSVPGGAAGKIGFGYTMKHRKSPFTFKVGLEFMYFNSSLKFEDFTQNATFTYKHPGETSSVDYNMNFKDYTESQNRFSLGVPIMFGGDFKTWYFGAGFAPNFALSSTYKVNTILSTTGQDDQLIGGFEGMPNHTFKESEPIGKGKLDLGVDLPLRVEGGVVLDKWMPSKAKQLRNRKKTKLSYRVGLWAEYGVLSINKNTPKTELLSFPPVYEKNSDGSYKLNSDEEKIVIPGALDPNEIHNVTPNSVMANSKPIKRNVNPLVVGAKFEVLMQVSQDPPKRKKKRPRPKKKPVKRVLPDPPYFYAVVYDYDTEEKLSADLKLYRLDVGNDTVFASTTAEGTGFTETRMKSDMFGIVVTKPGYIAYVDTVFQINNDTLHIDLQPIKVNTIVVLENLLFDTDKTVIKNASTQSLEDMFILLSENPDIKIEISGHTDDVGSARYNRKLSEGRAKAVYEEMIKRGIDASRMTWYGAGEDEPIDTNDTPEGRAENRRVEFKIVK